MNPDVRRSGGLRAACFAAPALTVALLALLIPGCGSPGPGAPPRAAGTRFEATFRSLDELAGAVLDGFGRRDFDGLERLRVTEREFTDRVWPELPVSASASTYARDYAWRDLSQKSRLFLRQSLAEHGGRRYALVRIEFAGETTTHRTFAVHRKSRLVVRDGEGATTALRLLGSVIESEGRFKVYSFVVD